MLIRMYQIEVSKIDMLLKRFNWGGPELLTLSYSMNIFWQTNQKVIHGRNRSEQETVLLRF